MKNLSNVKPYAGASVSRTRGQSKVERTEVASTKQRRVRRYNLALPEELFSKLEEEANKHNTTVVDMLRRFVKLGLLALSIEESPDAALLIREGNTEKQIMLL